jgi:uncharacterized protein YqeY
MGTTKETLELKLREAMRANDDVSRRTIRMILSAVKLAEIDKGQPLDETGITTILQKEVKIRQEAVQDAEKANRPDLIEAAKAEQAIIDTFLPKQLSEAEIEVLIREAIFETNASGPADMGKVMKAIMAKAQGRASGDKINQIVRRLLQPG